MNTSEYLLSPQANIPTFIYRLLGAYIGEPQGLVFGATLFLFYLPLKCIEPHQKILPLRHRHIQKVGAGLAPRGRNWVSLELGWVCPQEQDPASLEGGWGAKQGTPEMKTMNIF